MTKKQRRQMRSRERRKKMMHKRSEQSPTNPQLSPKKAKVKEKYNTACDFCTVRDGQCHCKIKMDTYFCSENCAFATNNPLGLPPYGTKYMKGGSI